MGAEISGQPLWLASALASACTPARSRSPTRRPRPIRRRRISTSPIRCRPAACAACSRPIRRWRSASPACEAMAGASTAAAAPAGRAPARGAAPHATPQPVGRLAAARPGRASSSTHGAGARGPSAKVGSAVGSSPRSTSRMRSPRRVMRSAEMSISRRSFSVCREVALEVVDPVVQPPHVAQQQPDRLLDLARLLAHAHVLQHGAHGVERRHHGGGRHDPDARAVGLLDHRRRSWRAARRRSPPTAGTAAPIRRSRRARCICRGCRRCACASPAGRRAAPAARPAASPAATARSALIALERELGVDGDRARRVGQIQQAVDARAGRQRATGTRRPTAAGRSAPGRSAGPRRRRRAPACWTAPPAG